MKTIEEQIEVIDNFLNNPPIKTHIVRDKMLEKKQELLEQLHNGQ